MKDRFDNVTILGVRVDIVSLDDLLEYVLFVIRGKRKAIIANVNVHAINLAQEHGWFRNFINQADVVFCDGFGVKWAANFLTGKELQRFTPPDWFDRLAGLCVRQNVSFFFLGARQDVVEKAASMWKDKYPGIQVVGFQNGYFNKVVDAAENKEVLARINNLKPDILVVGFGMPAQEKWILENWDHLNVRVVFPVGAFFDYLSGDVVRAPAWMTDHGFEWLGRLIIEPRRLWKRYILGNPIFVWKVLLQKIIG